MARPEVEVAPAKKGGVKWGSLAPGIVFILIVVVAAGFYLVHKSEAAQQVAAVQQQIVKLGLPDDFPLQDIAVYPGLKITTKKRLDAMSSDNKPMDEWEIHGTTPDDKKRIFDFVKDKSLARNMSQTQYISIPTGYGLTYGDEKYSVEYEIEKQKKDKETRVVMRVYRLQ